MNLFAFEQRHATIIGRATFPKGVLGGVADDRDLGADIARQLKTTPWWGAIVARLGLLWIWYSPLFLYFPRTFGGLKPEEQYALLNRLAGSHLYWLREMVMLVKMQICFAAVGDQRVLRALGAYDLAGGPVALKRRAS